MTRAAAFWDRIAARYARQPVADEVSYHRKLEVTRGYLRSDMEVLEIGCGTGSTAIVHAPHVKHIRALDISSNMIDIARERADAAGVHNVDFVHSGFDGASAPAGSVDAILALNFLHLVDDRDAVITSAYRMLGPGGVFITSTACITGLMRLIVFVAPIGRLFGVLPLVRAFTVDELERSMGDAGFRIEYQWQPGRDKAVFMVARKPTQGH